MWEFHGRAFSITGRTRFGAVLEKEFHLDKIASFFRQLGIYSIRRVKGKRKDVFKHSHFRRGREQDLIKIQRANRDMSRKEAIADYEDEKLRQRHVSRTAFLVRCQQQTFAQFKKIQNKLLFRKKEISKANSQLKNKTAWLRKQLDKLLSG